LNSDTFEVLVSQRSRFCQLKRSTPLRCHRRLAGAHVSSRFMYPAWQPDPTSPAARCIAAYRALFGYVAHRVIHAGLSAA
jgi:di/tripeptidase